ncbi:MAG: hypothetical protein IKT20_05805 [Clostridiales bacterium]|nr:hypothetical protein [Clostridiales bacterium]MBR6488405.1 hypothetical protein [Clostridiales bacterium]
MRIALKTASILIAAVMASSLLVSCKKEPAASNKPSIINTVNTGDAPSMAKDPDLGKYLIELTVYEPSTKEKNERWEQHYRIGTDCTLEMYGIFNGKIYRGKKIGLTNVEYKDIYDLVKANPLESQEVSIYMNNSDGWVRNLISYDKEDKVKTKIGGTLASGAAFDKICELILSFPNETEKSEFMTNVQTAVNKDYFVG